MTAHTDNAAENRAATELDVLCGVIAHLFPERSEAKTSASDQHRKRP